MGNMVNSKIAAQGLVTVLLFLTIFSCGLTKELVAFMENPGIRTPDLNQVVDGTYLGEYEVGPILVVAEVTVKNSEITKCTIQKHRSGKGKPAEAVVDTIVEKQSLDVDAVSGATYSSTVIRKAVQVALEKGM